MLTLPKTILMSIAMYAAFVLGALITRLLDDKYHWSDNIENSNQHIKMLIVSMIELLPGIILGLVPLHFL